MVLFLESIGPIGSCRPKAKADPKDAQKSRSNLRDSPAAKAPRRPGRLLKGKSRGILQVFPTPRLPLRLSSLGFFAFLFAHVRPEVRPAFYPHLHLAVCSHFPEKGAAGYHHVPREQGRKGGDESYIFYDAPQEISYVFPLIFPENQAGVRVDFAFDPRAYDQGVVKGCVAYVAPV